MAKEEHPFRIGFLIHDVSRLRRTVVDKALRPIGVTRSQWWVLANLSRHNGEGMMQTELAKVMDVGKVTLGGLVDRLEAGGIVARQADPQDRRAKRVVITPRGQKLLTEIQGIAKVVNARIMSGIPKADVASAEAVLHQMKQQLIRMDAVPGAANDEDEDED
jgi:DNA-binding MarR family transcriptional regulator